MLKVVVVMLGGALGSLLRYGLSVYIPASSFPWATLLANIAACFILGMVTGLGHKQALGNSWQLLLGTGFCGGFSTFSTFSKETWELGQHLAYWWSVAYVAASFLLGLLAFYLGLYLVSFKR